jgi:hypothetical protein
MEISMRIGSKHRNPATITRLLAGKDCNYGRVGKLRRFSEVPKVTFHRSINFKETGRDLNG